MSESRRTAREEETYQTVHCGSRPSQKMLVIELAKERAKEREVRIEKDSEEEETYREPPLKGRLRLGCSTAR